MTANDNEWQRMTASGTTSDNEWHNEWQQLVQQVTTSGKEWQRMTTSNIEWQWLMAISVIFFLFFFREGTTNRDPKGNPLNLEEDIEDDLLN